MDTFPLKRMLLALLALLVSGSAYAQSLVIHNAPQGKSLYASSAEWPAISGQCHWIPGDGSPAVDPPDTLNHDMAHTHAEYDAVPIWGELGNQTITIPITVQLFHTAGEVTIVTGVYGGTLASAYYIPTVMDTPGPWVGDPNGLVKFHGHLTVNLADALKFGPDVMPAHGWGGLTLFTRTNYLNGDQVDNETVVPVYSVVDVSQPEQPFSEGSLGLGAKCLAAAHNTIDSDIFGIHLIDIRDQLLPILAPFSAPLTIKAFGYNYGFDPGLPQDRPSVVHGTYTLLIDNDFHMGVPGTVNVPTTVPDGNIGNFDTLDPLWISQQTEPMSLKATNQHRLTFQWSVRTPDGGWTDQYGHPEPGGLELRSLLSINVTIAPNPVGCTPTLCPPIPIQAPPVVTTPPITPLPPPPTPSPVWITVSTPNRHDVQQLMTDPTTPVVPLQFRICQAGDANCSSSEIDK